LSGYSSTLDPGQCSPKLPYWLSAPRQELHHLLSALQASDGKNSIDFPLTPLLFFDNSRCLRGPAGARDLDLSTGQRSFAAYGPRTWNRLPTALRSPELSLSLFKRQLKTHLSVPALDSAGCSCGCLCLETNTSKTAPRVSCDRSCETQTYCASLE